MLAAWGRFVHRRRWWVLAASAVLLALSVAGIVGGGVLSSASAAGQQFPSTRAQDLVNQEITTGAPKGGSSFLLMLRSDDGKATDHAFRTKVQQAIAPLTHDDRVTRIMSPYDQQATPQQHAALTSKDGRAVLVQVYVRDKVDKAATYYPALRDQVKQHADGLQVTGTGQVPVQHAMNTTLEHDLRQAEVVSLPITLLLLILIFSTLIAAGLPLAVGLLTIAGGIGMTLLLAHATDVSQYALNIVTLIGLGVSIDYSLFVVTRYREELATGASPEDALSTTVATAGRAITFSGITVAIGLGALLFFPGTYLTSMGEAGMIVVATAVVYGLTFLPAALAFLGPRVERLRIPIRRRRSTDGGVWHAIAKAVMRRPLLVLLPTLGALLLAGAPFLHLRMANGGIEQLPPGSSARAGYEQLRREFPVPGDTQLQVVVRYPSGDPATPERANDERELARRIAAIPGVDAVLPPQAGQHIVVLTATTPAAPTSDEARDILATLRAERVDGAEVLVAGQTALDRDIVDFVSDHLLPAVGFVIGVTLLVLFLLTGSVVLPIKAVLSNMVSIAASFGALVWIFQDGNLSAQLGFTPQSLDPSIPVLLFAAVFGLSMDYEVLLVTRIQEEYQARGDNHRAVLTGLARSGGLITGAAAIMITVFLAFATSQIMLMKAIGLGLSIAVLLDATLLRGLVVPAVMRLMGRANWWAPRPLRWLHQRIGLGEATLPPPAPTANDTARLAILLLAAVRQRRTLPTPMLRQVLELAERRGAVANGGAPAPAPPARGTRRP
jgi:putative drug exporter of the RND superfamily